MRTTYTFESHYQNSFSHLQAPALGLFFLSSPHVQICPFPLALTWWLPAGGATLFPVLVHSPNSPLSSGDLEPPFKHKFPYSGQWVLAAQEKTGADWTRAPRAWHNHNSATLPSSLQSQFFSALLSGQLQSFVVVVPQLRVHIWRNDLDDSAPCSSTRRGPPSLLQHTSPCQRRHSLSFSCPKKVEVSRAPCSSVTTQT